MTWVRLIVDISSEYQELLIAELLELDFEGFEQSGERLEAWIPRNRFDDTRREQIEQALQLLTRRTAAESEGKELQFRFDEVEGQNWNEAWEKTVKPQSVGRFFIKPSWSRKEGQQGQTKLVIDPKMSFGTGYHPTTRLVLEEISEMKLKGRSVLDAGTGTGILAIAALKCGADAVFAFDNDEWSRDNAAENGWLNGVGKKFRFGFGGIETVPKDEKFDLVIANINKNVILEMLKGLAGHLSPGGRMLLTGLLYDDCPEVRKKSELAGLELVSIKQNEEWALLHLKLTKRD